MKLPKPNHPPESFSAAIINWSGGTLNPRSGYYAGRGPKTCDLGPDHLEKIYEGILKDFSPAHAKRFLDFVKGLDDLSASAFLVAFEYFYGSGCEDATGYKQGKGDFAQISAHGDDPDGRFIEGMGAILSALGDPRDGSMRQMESESIKRSFLMRHGCAPEHGPRCDYYERGIDYNGY